jgi:hypothetical protein
MIPVMSDSGEYYWVLQESYILQMNKEKQAISQFNIYTVVSKYEKPQEIMGWITGKYGVDIEKDTKLKSFFKKTSNFKLTKIEKQLLEQVSQDTKPSYKEISITLDKSEETVKKQAKNIIQKAKNAFPHYFHQHEKTQLKNVAAYLEHIDFEIESEN